MPPQIRESEVATQWDRNADVWTNQVRNRWDIFREHWNNPAFLEFAGDLSGKTVLDADTGISLSENPTLRIVSDTPMEAPLTLEATDLPTRVTYSATWKGGDRVPAKTAASSGSR